MMILRLDDENWIITLLRRDKHSVLEGVCTEYMFEHDWPTNSPKGGFSKGWWAVPLNRNNYMLFHVTIHGPSENDLRIYRQFDLLGVQVVSVMIVADTLHFWPFERGLPMNYLDYNSFTRRQRLYDTGNRFTAEEKERDESLQKRAISFMKMMDIYEEAVFQRFFANDFLPGHFPPKLGSWNLDGIILDKGKLTVIEVKFKYPKLNGSYGINLGQTNVFRWLMDKQIKVEHYIIYNPGCKKDIDFLDVLSSPMVRGQLEWLHHSLQFEDLVGPIQTAPPYSSYKGNRLQRYIEIPQQGFKKIPKMVADGVGGQIIDDRLCPMCGKRVVIRSGSRGLFLGCTGYRRDGRGCPYTL